MTATFSGGHEGWLLKQGGIIRNWKRRWAAIRGTQLLYFQDKDASKQRGAQKGTVDLSNAKLQTFTRKDYDRDFAFGVTPANQKRTVRVRCSCSVNYDATVRVRCGRRSEHAALDDCDREQWRRGRRCGIQRAKREPSFLLQMTRMLAPFSLARCAKAGC